MLSYGSTKENNMTTKSVGVQIAELLGAIVGIIIVISIVVLIISLFPALIGWALGTVVGLFVPVDLTYWQYVGLGIGFAIIATVTASIARG
jgi:hypothetical protein